MCVWFLLDLLSINVCESNFSHTQFPRGKLFRILYILDCFNYLWNEYGQSRSNCFVIAFWMDQNIFGIKFNTLLWFITIFQHPRLLCYCVWAIYSNQSQFFEYTILDSVLKELTKKSSISIKIKNNWEINGLTSFSSLNLSIFNLFIVIL